MFLAAVLALFLDRSWEAPEPLASLNDPRINESSGVAASPLRSGVYYTHNDSGDTARFFRFSRTGVDAMFTLQGAGAIDWEDMASAKIEGDSWLYFGDVGDNSTKRKSVTVYRVPEPDSFSRTLAKFDTYRLTYPDKPHNCEALIVDPKSGDLYLVTKHDTEALVFRLAAPKSSGEYRLERVGEIHPDTGLGKYGKLVTAADADPSGTHVVVRTYSGALEYTVSGAFRDWWKQKPQPVTMPLDAQGEAVCYANGGQSLVTTSEGSPCPVHLVKQKKI